MKTQWWSRKQHQVLFYCIISVIYVLLFVDMKILSSKLLYEHSNSQGVCLGCCGSTNPVLSVRFWWILGLGSDPVHTTFTRVRSELKTALKSLKTPLCSHSTGSKLCENFTLIRAIWKRFLNGARWRKHWRCCVNTKIRHFFRSTLVPNHPYLKTVLTLTAFRVIFFALFEKNWGLSEFLLTYLSTNFNGFVWTHEKWTVPLFSRAGIMWT